VVASGRPKYNNIGNDRGGNVQVGMSRAHVTSMKATVRLRRRPHLPLRLIVVTVVASETQSHAHQRVCVVRFRPLKETPCPLTFADARLNKPAARARR